MNLQSHEAKSKMKPVAGLLHAVESLQFDMVSTEGGTSFHPALVLQNIGHQPDWQAYIYVIHPSIHQKQ